VGGTGSGRDRGALALRSPGRPTAGLLVKLLLLGVVNGTTLLALPRLVDQGAWLAVASVVAATAAIDVVYLGRWAVPMKWLLPGTLFMLGFQVYPVAYSAYISFTNYSTGNILSKDQALEQILRSAVRATPDAPRFTVTPLVGDGGELGLYLTDEEGQTFVGTAEGVEPVDVPPEEVEGFEPLGLRDANARGRELLDLEVPTDEGIIQVQTATSAALVESVLDYDESADTITNTETGVVYRPVDGQFRSDDGDRLEPGWKTVVGLDNYTRIVDSEAIRGPFFRVFVWNYVFTVLSVVITFAVGLGLALVLDHPGVRGRRVYRSLLVVPYALPSFMTALIWAGLLNAEFGAVNRLLGVHVDWLTDPTLAKASVLLVNTWLGFPYMFLVCTGALQAIPGELKEAAYVDGAGPWAAFRRVTFPLLLISLAPLLIASFAFNFNNFNVIYLLNRGGPPIVGAQTPAGHTDILISYTYRLAFEGGRGADFGFASSISMLIFVMVAGISAVSFRRTRALEDLR
jgi:arabinogalactan oligomer / maltooligosaccharide transport system permease protein